MNFILKHLLDLRHIEYFILAENLTILEVSSGASLFFEPFSELALGQEIQRLFPKLVGAEPALQSVLEAQQSSLEMKAITRSPNAEQVLYFDLFIIRASEKNATEQQLVLFLKDTPEDFLV